MGFQNYGYGLQNCSGLWDNFRTIATDFKVDAMDFYGHNKNICKIKD
jgi:hypothetical protein